MLIGLEPWDADELHLHSLECLPLKGSKTMKQPEAIADEISTIDSASVSCQVVDANDIASWSPTEVGNWLERYNQYSWYCFL